MKFKSFLHHEYVRHIATLGTGTFLAQLIPICTYPLLSRLFTPEDFGILATFSQIASILAIVASGKFETNILIEENNLAARNLFYFIIVFSFGILSLLFILTFCVIKFLAIEIFQGSTYLFVPFVMAMMIIVYQCYNEWCVRNKRFKNLSLNKIINTSAISTVEIIFAISKILGGAGLFIGDMVGRAISALVCLISFNKLFKFDFKSINLKLLWESGKRNIDCPKYVMPAQLINVLGGSLPVLLIGVFFDQSDVGLYSMANMVIVVPASVLSLAIKDVFRQKASISYAADGQCKDLYIKNFFILGGLSFVIFVVLFIIIKPLFSIFLGHQWVESATFAELLIPMVFVSFISDALSSMMVIGRKLNYIFYWQLLYFFFSGIPLLIGGYIHNIYLCLGLFSIGRIVAHIINLIISYRIAKGSV